MRANLETLAGRIGAAVNAQAKRRLDGKPRPVSSRISPGWGGLGPVSPVPLRANWQTAHAFDKSLTLACHIACGQVITHLIPISFVPLWDWPTPAKAHNRAFQMTLARAWFMLTYCFYELNILYLHTSCPA
jgi:hypothetical protein